MKKTKVIMFDYDGVLINSNHLPHLYYNELAGLLGTKKFQSIEECREYLEADVHKSLQRLGVTTPEQMQIAMDLFRKRDNQWKNLQLFPKVRELLQELKQKGYILAIVSNNNQETIVHDLKKNNVFEYFDHVLDTSYGRKPEITQILHCLKVTDALPEEAVLIDDMDGGLIAAKKAKLKKAIGVSYGFQLPYRLHMADIIVNNPLQILDVIE